MSLTSEIIAACADDSTPLATILRKCLILATELKSEELKSWVLQELEGYDDAATVPPYRVMGVTAKGLFLGGFGAQINDQPLPSSVLRKDHRHWATTAMTGQGVASMEALVANDPTGSARVNWPADMVAHYQSKFFEGYALNRAWQEIPIPALVEILDTVRTKVLKFILELQEKLGDLSDLARSPNVEEKAPAINNIFQTTVYGGTAIVASTTLDVDSRTQTIVAVGDFNSLIGALKGKGVAASDINALKTALEQDQSKPELPEKSRVRAWISATAKKIGGAASGAVLDSAKASLTALISSYLGPSS